MKPHSPVNSDNRFSIFGQSLEGPVAQIVVRNWGALIGLMGVLLIYGAFREEARNVALLVAGASKLVFIVLVLSLGQPFLQFQVGISVVVDAIMIVLFATYLIAHESQRTVRPDPSPMQSANGA